MALLEWLERERVNWQFLRKAYERVWEHPFDTKRRLMAVIVSDGSGKLDFYVKGALESLSYMCERVCTSYSKHRAFCVLLQPTWYGPRA